MGGGKRKDRVGLGGSGVFVILCGQEEGERGGVAGEGPFGGAGSVRESGHGVVNLGRMSLSRSEL